MKYDIKRIMRDAWAMAENAVFKFGGKKTDYFAECLKNEWALHKMLENARNTEKKQPAERIEKTTNEIAEIKAWFVRKNFDQNEAYVIDTNDYIEVVEETAKAYKLVVHNTKLGNLKTWAPKACCVA